MSKEKNVKKGYLLPKFDSVDSLSARWPRDDNDDDTRQRGFPLKWKIQLKFMIDKIQLECRWCVRMANGRCVKASGIHQGITIAEIE